MREASIGELAGTARAVSFASRTARFRWGGFRPACSGLRAEREGGPLRRIRTMTVLEVILYGILAILGGFAAMLVAVWIYTLPSERARAARRRR